MEIYQAAENNFETANPFRPSSEEEIDSGNRLNDSAFAIDAENFNLMNQSQDIDGQIDIVPFGAGGRPSDTSMMSQTGPAHEYAAPSGRTDYRQAGYATSTAGQHANFNKQRRLQTGEMILAKQK